MHSGVKSIVQIERDLRKVQSALDKVVRGRALIGAGLAIVSTPETIDNAHALQKIVDSLTKLETAKTTELNQAIARMG